MNDTETGAPLANAGMRFPPPFIYFIAIIVAFVLNRLVPFWIAAPEPRWMFYGGLGCWRWACWSRSRAPSPSAVIHTAIIPHKPARRSSPAARTRSRGIRCISGSGSFSSASRWSLDSWWAVLAVPVALLIVDRTVIPKEERYLASAFGEEYERYRGRVRRWI